jgi:hypothetical protein
MATCKICKKTDAQVEFYDSINTYCKEHWKERVRVNRLAKPDQYKEFDRKRANLPHRVAARETYRKTDAFQQSHSKAAKKWDAINHDRKAATTAVNNAVRDGKLIKLPCLICGAKSQAHHPDSSEPLCVVWLCSKHHAQAHILTREILREEKKAAQCAS